MELAMFSGGMRCGTVASDSCDKVMCNVSSMHLMDKIVKKHAQMSVMGVVGNGNYFYIHLSFYRSNSFLNYKLNLTLLVFWSNAKHPLFIQMLIFKTTLANLIWEDKKMVFSITLGN